jgi:hypothetical protein
MHNSLVQLSCELLGGPGKCSTSAFISPVPPTLGFVVRASTLSTEKSAAEWYRSTNQKNSSLSRGNGKISSFKPSLQGCILP